MSKRSINVNVDQKDNQLLRSDVIVDKNKITSPTIDFRYLCKSSKCLKYLYKNLYKSNNEAIDDFQKFVFGFSTMISVSEAVKKYSSHINGGKLNPKKLKFIENILNKLLPEVSAYAKNEITHLHFKSGGNADEMTIGFLERNCYYVLGFINHKDFIKK